MPFRKRNVRRVRRRFRRQAPGLRALHMVRKLKSVLAIEKKAHTLTVAGAIDDAGSIFQLTNIAQGDTNQLRDGNQIKVLYVGGRIQWTQNDTARITFVRTMIVQDRQQIADAAPAVGTVLQSASVNAYLNTNTLGRFKVLYDKVHTLSDTGTEAVFLRVNLPMNSKVRYNGTALTDIQKNGIFLLLISTQPINTPSVASSLRVRFTDN